MRFGRIGIAFATAVAVFAVGAESAHSDFQLTAARQAGTLQRCTANAPAPFKSGGMVVQAGQIRCSRSAVVLYVLRVQVADATAPGGWNNIAMRRGFASVRAGQTRTVRIISQCIPGTYRDIFRVTFHRQGHLVNVSRTSAPSTITCP